MQLMICFLNLICKERRVTTWLLLGSLLLLGSCASRKKLSKTSAPATTSAPSATSAPANAIHLPDTLPALPASEIDLPLKIYAPPILRTADSTVPKEFTSEGWPAYLKTSCEFRYKYRFVRSGFTLTCSNNKLALQWDGKYQVAGSRCFCTFNKPVSPWVSGSCGFGDEPLRRVNMSISSQLYFLPDYRLQSHTRLEQLKAQDKCVVSIMSSDVTQQVVDSIRSSVNTFCHILDSTVGSLNFTAWLQQIASKAWQKTPVGHYGYLVINPEQVRIGQLNYARDTFSISAGISCRLELGSDTNSRAGIPPLPPLNAGNNRDGAYLYLALNYDYPFIGKLLHDSLYNRTFLVKGNTVIIKDIAIRGAGNHQIEIKVDFAGSRKGRIYIKGTPVLDTVKQTLTVPDISYSLESRDLALKIARTLLKNKIRRSLQGNSYLDLAALIKTNLPALDSQLNTQIAPGLYTRGHMKEVRMTGLLAGEKFLQMQLYLHANLSVTSTGMPRFGPAGVARQ